MLWLLVVFDGYDLIVYGTVKPTLIAEWGMSQETAGTVGSAAFLGMMIGAVAAGRLSDSLGRKRAVVASTVLFTVATVLCGVVDGPLWFAVLRFVAGVGLGGPVPSANALAAGLVPPGRRLAAGDAARAEAPRAGFGALLRPDMLLISSLFALAAMGTMFAWYGLGTELPNLMRLQGAQLGGPLVFALVLNLGAVVGSFLTAWGGDRFGPLVTGAVGSVLALVGLMVILNTPVTAVGLIYAMLVLCGIGTHGTLALIIGAATVHFLDHLRGTALGWTMGVGRLGAVLAPAVAGQVLGGHASPVDGVGPVFALFAGAAAVAAVTQFALMPLVRRHPGLVWRHEASPTPAR